MTPPPDPYAARHAHFALAGRAASLWVIFGGLLLIEVAWIAGGWALIPWAADRIDTAARSLGALFVFLVLAGATALVTERLQKRAAVTLVGRRDRLLSDGLGVVRWMALVIAAIYVLQTDWSDLALAMPVLRWVLLLPFAILGVLVQTAAEELLYRGYLQQSLGARFDHPAVWMLLPSALFGLSHYDPTLPGDTALAYVIWTAIFGLAAADLTARTGSLGAAIAFHFAHNLQLVVLVSIPGDLSGLSLFHYPVSEAEYAPTAIGLAFQLFYIWMIWMAARIAIRR